MGVDFQETSMRVPHLDVSVVNETKGLEIPVRKADRKFLGESSA